MISTTDVTRIAKDAGIPYVRVYSNVFKDLSCKRVKFYGLYHLSRDTKRLIELLSASFPGAKISVQSYSDSVTIHIPIN